MFIFILQIGIILLFDFFQKNKGFLGPSQLPKNPPNAIFYTFIRISFLFPFILYSSQHFIGVILLIFFDVFKNLAPKWPFFWDFYSWPYLKNPLLFFKALLPMQGTFVVIHFHFSCFFSQMMFLSQNGHFFVYFKVDLKWPSWVPFFGGKWPLWGQVCSV